MVVFGDGGLCLGYISVIMGIKQDRVKFGSFSGFLGVEGGIACWSSSFQGVQYIFEDF